MPSARVLPPVSDVETYRALHKRNDRWGEALRAIADRHRLDISACERTASGGNIAFFAGPHVIKLFAPIWLDEQRREQEALAIAGGRLSVAVPSLVADGEIDDWAYLVVERLPGREIGHAWPLLEPRDKLHLAEALGALLAELHALPPPAGGALAIDWPAFVEERIAGAVAFQRRCGVSEALLERVPQWLADAAPLVPDARRSLLHGDVNHQQVLIAERRGRLELSGLFDFGDSIVGHPDYELISPIFLITKGEPGLSTALLHGYGIALDEHRSRRLMAWSVLHQFNDLTRYIPGPGDAGSLELLRQRYWPVG
jgi:hygromycin-B 7''-O-kinase